MFHVGIAQYLGAAIDDLGYSEAPGGNVFVDLQPSEPDRAVSVFATSSGEADSRLPWDPKEALIIVRSDADTQWALAVWQKIHDALHGLRNYTLPDGTYVAFVLVTSASPNRLGSDATGRQGYGLTIRAEILNQAPGRETA